MLKQDVQFLPLYLILKQAGKRDVSEELKKLNTAEEDLKKLEETEMITYIKGNKKQNLLQKMRLTKKSKKYLDSLDEVEVSEEDLQFFEWLKGIYIKRDKKIGNGAKTKRLIAQFREKSGIEKNHLATLCNHFINNDDEQEWSFMLEYIFWKPVNVFQTKFALDQSRLYQYYLDKKEYFDAEFKRIDKES